jgi:dihydroxyacetone kinase phosphoprotein-dependent L subunit
VRALIFDCDGVLSDTEREGHLPAFNRTFCEFGLPVQWSEEEYGERLKIGGGKERMASLLTPEFTASARLPPDHAAQMREVARWHKRKTEIYIGMVAEGRLPPRPGIARLIGEALDDGWLLAVASTSARESVEAILERAAGRPNAARFAAVLAGDVVANKKPAPDIYNLAIERLGVDRPDVLVIEDSRNGLQAAVAAGLRCLITVSSYTRRENFDEALLVVTDLGEPGGGIEILANRSNARPQGWIRMMDLSKCLKPAGGIETTAPTGTIDAASIRIAEAIVRSMAQTAVDNERYFCELDSIVGDGDFGFSLARGFEKVLQDFDSFDRTDVGTFLQKVSAVITSRCGGTSGPIWGTGFRCAGKMPRAAGSNLTAADAAALLRAALDGIMKRGGAALGDKTLLDALAPLVERFEERINAGSDSRTAFAAAVDAAEVAAQNTSELVAKRGRAAYTGDRSRGSPDAGATALALMAKNVSAALSQLPPSMNGGKQ